MTVKPSSAALLTALVLLATGSAAWASAQVNVSSMNVDGLRVRDLSCDLDQGGGFMGGMIVVGTLAAQKPALDACAPQGGAYTVTWGWEQGATTVKAVVGLPESGQECVSQAMAAMESGSTGSCQAVVLVGEEAGADKALAAQSAPEPPAVPAAPPVAPQAPAPAD